MTLARVISRRPIPWSISENTWKTKTITVTDAVMAGNGPNGCDFALCNSDGLDDVFHMIEIERPLRGGSKLRADGAGEH
ncbi:MAG: hypothetical protein GY774_06020 [Planctomycetes bacterium]|nr:hypothetical protein [Planctomycetota bacterium]